MATWTKGWFYLQPGQTMTFAVSWAPGQDPGVQAMVARPWAPTTTKLKYEVTTESYALASQLVSLYSSSYPYGPYPHKGWSPPPKPLQTQWTYSATFRNTGQDALWCSLTGGQVG